MQRGKDENNGEISFYFAEEELIMFLSNYAYSMCKKEIDEKIPVDKKLMTVIELLNDPSGKLVFKLVFAPYDENAHGPLVTHGQTATEVKEKEAQEEKDPEEEEKERKAIEELERMYNL